MGLRSLSPLKCAQLLLLLLVRPPVARSGSPFRTISVIVPCYNHGSTLRRALESVVTSTVYFQEWWAKLEPAQKGSGYTIAPIVELVVVDDESDDITSQVAREFSTVQGLPLRYLAVQHKPEGSQEPSTGAVRVRRPGAARNAGVKSSAGDLILYLDADDVYHPDHIQRIFQPFMWNHTIGYVKARMEFQVPMHPEWGVTIERVSPINGGVRRALHDLIGGYPDLANAEDASYWNMVRALSNGLDPELGDTPTSVYVLSPGNHLETQQDKFSHPPGDSDRFEKPVTGPDAQARKNAETIMLKRIRERIMSVATGKNRPEWLDASSSLNNIGLMFKLITEWDQAMESYSAAVRMNPNNDQAFYNMGVLFGLSGKSDDAEKAYKAAIRARPTNTAALYNLGVLQRDAGRLPEAEASYRAAVQVEPEHSLAYNGLATCVWSQGRVEEAEGLFKAALEHHPSDATLLNNLGGLYAQSGKLRAAKAFYQMALQLDPTHLQAQKNMAALLSHKTNSQRQDGEL